MKRLLSTGCLLGTLAMLLAARDAFACAMCGLPPGDIATHAYNTSVLFMLTVPYAIVVAGAVVGFVAYRNACRRESAAERGHTLPPISNR